jgi:hypothetical protein
LSCWWGLVRLCDSESNAGVSFNYQQGHPCW